VIFTAGKLISRSITRPILKLVDIAKAIGRGDFNRENHLKGKHNKEPEIRRPFFVYFKR
jgi:nitrogen fixation/metabolism regulation signal transduction histidine kinase